MTALGDVLGWEPSTAQIIVQGAPGFSEAKDAAYAIAGAVGADTSGCFLSRFSGVREGALLITAPDAALPVSVCVWVGSR